MALALGLSAATAVGCSGSSAVRATAAAPRAQPAARPAVPVERAPTTLEFAELVSKGPTLEPSERARQLAGQRVRMVGFMAELELPLSGAFFLTSRPIHGDEGGAGTGELPIDAVLVSLPLRDRPLPHVDGAVEVVGVWEVGNRADESGHASNFRIRVDDPRLLQAQQASAAR